MRRGPKPAKSKEAKLPVARKLPKDNAATVRDLEKRLAEALRDKAEALEQLQTRDRELFEALDQQTATGEILKVISRSPTDIQPVFDAIAESAVRLCDALFGGIFRVDGQSLRAVGRHGPIAVQGRVMPITRGTVAGRTVLERRAVHVIDLQAEVEEFPEGSAIAKELAHRTTLGVPLLREETALGAIVVRRAAAKPFTDKQIALLQTFADQAVIAIENVRLFNETKEALERQTATSEILRVISSSPTDLQPVLDAVAERAARLCNADDVKIHLVDGDTLRLAAQRGPIPSVAARPIIPTRHIGRAVLERQTIHVHDMRTALDQFPDAAADVLTFGPRTSLATPLLREGVAIGVIQIRRLEVKPFSATQIALLEMFADQSVIAIENVRLFTELQEKNRALTEAHAQVTESLEQQTATAEILRVISRSPTDEQPVFDAIIASAVRLLGGHTCGLTRVTGDQLELVALTGIDAAADAPVRAAFPQSLHAVGAHPRAVRDRVPLNVADAQADARLAEGERVFAGIRGFRSWVVVPMLRDDVTIGSIGVTRREAGGFTADEIALLKTFADQAVIAIENVRLFKELQEKNRALTEAHAQVTEALDQQTATAEVLRIISTSPTELQPVLEVVVKSAVRFCGADDAIILRLDGETLWAAAHYGPVPVDFGLPVPCVRGTVGGRSVLERRAVHVLDLQAESEEFPEGSAFAKRLGARTTLGVPLLREGTAVGTIQLRRAQVDPFTDKQIELLKTFADQAVIAIENVRLFKELEASNREIADKSRQIEVASQHKSEFLANMSHELRTPLNAIIGFSEVLSDRMFGELNEKQEEYLKDIYASGTHLLSLINDILDLSKIEAGRMELELTEFDLPTALDNALMLIRERAGRRSIALHTDIDGRLGQVQADERKVRQVVLNLLSNAIKFTPDGGRIDVGAVPKDGSVEVSVSDTGIGIAPEDQEKVFEEFRQVGTAAKKVEGTGLGLTLCRKFVELHGGRIWVKSQEGVGSTFTFSLPLRNA